MSKTVKTRIWGVEVELESLGFSVVWKKKHQPNPSSVCVAPEIFFILLSWFAFKSEIGWLIRSQREREKKKRSHEKLKDEGMGWDSIFVLFSIEFHAGPTSTTISLANCSTRPSSASGSDSPHHLLQRSRGQSSHPIQGSTIFLFDFVFFFVFVASN